MQPYEIRVRVRYAETDQMGVVHHANYLVWMELARVEFSKAHGFSYKEMEERDGIFMVVAEVRVRYSAPAHFDEEVTILTTLEEANPRMLRFSYEMRGPGGRKLVTAETKHVFCDRNLRPCRYRLRRQEEGEKHES